MTPPMRAQPISLRIVKVHVHCHLPLHFRYRRRQVEIGLKLRPLRIITVNTVNLEPALPIPLPDRCKAVARGARRGLQKLGIHDGMERFPFDPRRRLRKTALWRMHVQPDRPKLRVVGLAELEFIHPMADLSGVDIDVNAPLEKLHKRRTNRVAHVQQSRGSREALTKFPLAHSVKIKTRNILLLRGLALVKQHIVEPVAAHPLFKNPDTPRIKRRVARCWHQLHPKGIGPQPFQSQSPLERDGEIASALRILRRKSTAQENRASILHIVGKS